MCLLGISGKWPVSRQVMVQAFKRLGLKTRVGDTGIQVVLKVMAWRGCERKGFCC